MKGSGMFNVGIILHPDTCIENIILVEIELFNSSPSIWRILTDQTPKCLYFRQFVKIESLNESDVFYCCLDVKKFIFKICDLDLPYTALGLNLTRYLIMVYICAQLLGNPMMHGWDVGWTR